MIDYRDYQIDGVKFLMRRRGAILGDDMGSGKTLQSLSAALFLYLKGDVDKILIVCQKSLVANWREEIAKFFNLQVYEHTGPKRDVKRLLKEDLVITTYKTLVLDEEKYPRKTNKQGYTYEVNISDKTCVIVDEAHNAKNRSTHLSCCLYAIKAKYMWLLTGTPMHNKPEDIYGLLKICDNSLMNADEWADMFYIYEPVLDKRGNQVYYYHKGLKKRVPAKRVAGYKNLEMLSNLLRRYMLRREKKEILPHLPKNHINTVYYELDSEFNHKMDLLTEKHKDKIALIGKTFELLQGVYEGSFSPGEKAELLIDMIQGTEGRVVVWTTHLASTKGLSKYLRKLKREVFVHTGEMSAKKQDESIKNWQKTEGAILISTIQSGGTGLNLVEADTQFFYGMSYNASENDQAEARLHRSGQENEVNTYYLIGSNSLEARLWGLVQKKRKFAQALYSGNYIDDLYNLILKL